MDMLQPALECFFSSALEGIQILDRQLVYLFINQEAEGQNRRPSCELLGKHYCDPWPGVASTDVYATILHVLNTKQSRRMETRFVFPDGSFGWYDLRIEPFQEGIILFSLDITSLKMSQAISDMQLEHFRLALAQSPIPMSVTDPHSGRWLRVNPAFCQLCERTELDLVGHTEEEIHLWQSSARRKEFLSLLSAEGSLVNFETKLLTPGGRVKTVLLNAQNMVLSWGSCFFIQGLDITEREESYQMLRLSEEKHRLLEENIADVVWVLDIAKQRFTYVSPSVKKLRGFSPDEVMSQPLAKALTHESGKHVEAVLPARIQDWNDGSRAEYIDTLYQPTKSGGVVATEATTRFAFDANEQSLLIYGCSRDITARLEENRKHVELSQEFKAIFDSSFLAIGVWDAAGCLVLGNKRFFSESRISDPLGKPIQDFFPELASIIDRRIREIRTLPRGKTFTTELKTRLGFKKLRTTYQPLWDAEGNYQGFQTFALDVTENSGLVKDALNVEKLSAISLLAGGLSHDLNNLLAGLYGNLELSELFLRENNYERVSDTLKKSSATLRRAQSLTKRIMQFSQNKSSETMLINLQEKIRDWATFALAGSSLELVLDIPPDLWNCECDEDQFSQVFDNLLINARQASPESGHLWITARNLPDFEPCLEIVIEDEGPGFSDEALGHLWEPRFTTKSNGNGLGLAGAKIIIEQHNGSVIVGRSPHGGALVRITIPALPSRGSCMFDEHAVDFKDSGKVLLMDDDPQVRETITGFLESFGYEVVQACNGHDAMTYYDSIQYSDDCFKLVLLDLTIPGGMGGTEVAFNILQSLAKRPAIIGMTGYVIDKKEKDHSSFDKMLLKPFSRRLLAQEIEQIVGVGQRHSAPV